MAHRQSDSRAIPCNIIAILTGGQTGVDDGALSAAEALGIPVRGWCPPGRRRDGGVIPSTIPLVETPEERSPHAPEVPRSLRTEWNVRDADATLIVAPADLLDDAGTNWTARACELYGKPWLRIDPWQAGAADDVAAWIARNHIAVLNVAGPSEAVCRGIAERADGLLREVIGRVRRLRK